MAVPYYGDYDVGAVVYLPFNTFDSNDPSASVTITNLINTDIHIHKNGGVAQRNNAAGVTMSVDFDTITGNHMVAIDTADNTVADFFVPGADYSVRMEGTTVDAATVNAWIGSFSLNNRASSGRLIGTTIATLASQTSFTLTAGSTDNNAYVNCTAIITDRTTAVQKCHARISAYTGGTKTVTLAADPAIFTIAALDSIVIYAGAASANVASVASVASVAQTGDSFALIGATGSGLTSLAQSSVLGAVATAAGTGDPDAAKTIMAYIKQLVNVLMGTDGIATFPAEAAPGNAVSLAEVIRAIHADVNELQTDWTNAGRLDAILDIIAADTTTDIPAAISAAHTTTDGKIDTVDGIVDNILTDTGTTLNDKIDVIDGIVDNILTDTGTTLDGKADQIIAATITNAAGVDIAADIIAVKAETATIVADTNELQTDDIPTLIGGLNNISTAQVNAEVVDALATDTYTEPGQGAPGVTISLATKIGYLYKAWRNKKDNDGSTRNLYNDNTTTVDQKSTVSEAGGTVTVGEVASGP